MPNKSYPFLLYVDPDNGFDEIIIEFTVQNRRPLEIENKTNLTLLISK